MAKAKAEFHTPGLAEPGLVSTVEELLSSSNGVEYAHVNLGAARTTVNFDDSVTGVETLIAALKKAGVEATQL